MSLDDDQKQKNKYLSPAHLKALANQSPAPDKTSSILSELKKDKHIYDMFESVVQKEKEAILEKFKNFITTNPHEFSYHDLMKEIYSKQVEAQLNQSAKMLALEEKFINKEKLFKQHMDKLDKFVQEEKTVKTVYFWGGPQHRMIQEIENPPPHFSVATMEKEEFQALTSDPVPLSNIKITEFTYRLLHILTEAANNPILAIPASWYIEGSYNVAHIDLIVEAIFGDEPLEVPYLGGFQPDDPSKKLIGDLPFKVPKF